MELTHQSIASALVLFCACIVAATSVPPESFDEQNGVARKEDLAHLVTLIGKLKNIARARKHHSSSASVLPAIVASTNTKNNAILPTSSRLVSEFPDDVTDGLLLDDDNNDDLDVNVLRNGYLGDAKTPNGARAVKKRQGAWSYDYGLGGGRFGKRNYGDYGIGGGRFGRDVDHVDLSDASDMDVSS